MSSTMGGLSTALSALQAQRLAMDVTGQNIANANTDGYSRQRVDLQAVGASAVGARWSLSDGVGNGVTSTGIDRIQDSFLEAQGRAAHAQNSNLAVQQQTYDQVEQVFNEPSDTGLQSQMFNFWNSLHDLTNNPGDMAARTQVIDQAKVLTDGLNSAYSALSSSWSSTRTALSTSVTDINTAADTVAQLNQQIQQSGAAGQSVNELADQRDLQLQKLSELTGAAFAAQPDGTVSVYLGGSSLVNGASARHVQDGGAGVLGAATATPVALTWTDNGTPAVPASGSAAANLNALNTILPGMSGQLDQVASTLATMVNAQHMAGRDLNGNPGKAFFSGTTASTITVALTDPTEVAAAGAGGGALDGSNADALASLQTSTLGPDALYKKMITDLGVASQDATRRAGIQSTVTSKIDSSRIAQSGVSLDEEMTNMISFQRGYEAASKVLSTIDSTLDTLINHVLV